MDKWARLAATFPIVMLLVDQAQEMKEFSGSKTSPEYDRLVANLIDQIVNAVETAVGKDLLDNAKLRAAVLAGLDDIVIRKPADPAPPAPPAA